ncbi:MAG: hypothetical protein NTY41_05080, partial [Proteobacteria bacterium]|nr:hypothetical protein [Pseudomonadota bacterium]
NRDRRQAASQAGKAQSLTQIGKQFGFGRKGEGRFAGHNETIMAIININVNNGLRFVARHSHSIVAGGLPEMS